MTPADNQRARTNPRIVWHPVRGLMAAAFLALSMALLVGVALIGSSGNSRNTAAVAQTTKATQPEAKLIDISAENPATFTPRPEPATEKKPEAMKPPKADTVQVAEPPPKQPMQESRPVMMASPAVTMDNLPPLSPAITTESGETWNGLLSVTEYGPDGKPVGQN